VEKARKLEQFGEWLSLNGYIRANSTYYVTKYGLEALLEMAKNIKEK